ncbi:MAG: hypothetical protein LBE37_13055 [Sphingobacterium sp.]|jgi:hypothetical protein|nr:hypothetical protein [Sphingobacterium sp.]
MKNVFLLVFLLAFVACKDQFDPIDKVHVTFTEDITDLNIPENSVVEYENIKLTMFDINNWNETYEYQILSLKEGVEVQKGSYSDCLVTMDVFYINNGIREKILAEAYLGIISQSIKALNFIDPNVHFDIKLRRRKF